VTRPGWWCVGGRQYSFGKWYDATIRFQSRHRVSAGLGVRFAEARDELIPSALAFGASACLSGDRSAYAI
jgi:putative salt-induced outer membrane protein YdiY